ncbi:hypothetical protein DDP54_08880 [Cellulomonas sp. WB94]|uniref:hypothetical protein n=1 Tax=Cellulomonas sp. WB94 TaxID=2173174 RepID=UPI000D5876AC|nr:hypothetical protein [Cellulomonas sp. WB94]PVU83098.1 hypothetical protein DDP54_08880 [Cellulomonas sp. WB94]
MLAGLLGVAVGIAIGWYLTGRAAPTTRSRLALVVLMLVAAGVTVLGDGDLERAAAGAGGGLTGALLTDAVRSSAPRRRRAAQDRPVGTP